VLLIAGLGWISARTGALDPGVYDGLGAFAICFALPALVLRLIASQPLYETFEVRFFVLYVAAGSIAFIGTLACGRLRRLPMREAGALATTATAGNLGFLGPPLVAAMFGSRASGPMCMAMVAEVLVWQTIGSVAMASAGGATLWKSAVLRGVVFNPVALAMAVGVVLAATRARMPAVADEVLRLLGSACGPAALFALGGSLALQAAPRAQAVPALAISAIKLVVYPLLVWLFIARIGGEPPVAAATAVMLASPPPASSNYLLALRFQACPVVVSAAIALGTTLSIVTVPLSMWAFGSG
jgi:hypothetical protein